MAVVLLCCTLGVLLGTRTAHAQAAGGGPTGTTGLDVGTVEGLTITTSDVGPNGVTTPVNTDATFTAAASAGTAKFSAGFTPGWTIVPGGPTYRWYIDGAAPGAPSAAAPRAQPAASPAASPPTLPLTYSPANTAKTTVTIPGGSPAITSGYVVTITCAVTYGALGPDGKQPGYLVSSVSKTIKVYIIGGPIDPAGDKDVRYYCDYPTETPPLSAAETGHLTAADNQPADTTYSWSITGSAIVTDGGTTPKATYRSTGSGKASAVVTYTLNGQSTSSPAFDIYSREPKIGKAVASGPSADHIYYDALSGYGFDQQSIVYTVVDQDKLPMSGVPVEEVIRLIRFDALANTDWPVPEQTATVTSGDGTFTDFFSTVNYALSGRPGDPAVLKRPESEPIAYLKHWWYAGPSNPNTEKGCVLEYYPNVLFSTNGVTGD